MTAEHSIKQVWTWGEWPAKKMSWQCTCGFEPRVGISGLGDVNQTLRKSHFSHVKAQRKQEARPSAE